MTPIIGWVLKLLSLAVAAGGVFFVHKKYKTKSDSVIEEFVEKEIKEETGVDIDLSPEDSDPDEASK